MTFRGTISLGSDVLAGVAGTMDGISGTQGGYYGDFVLHRGAFRAFDPDALYRLDIANGPSMGVHVRNSAGLGSAEGEALFRSRGVPAGRPTT